MKEDEDFLVFPEKFYKLVKVNRVKIYEIKVKCYFEKGIKKISTDFIKFQYFFIYPSTILNPALEEENLKL